MLGGVLDNLGVVSTLLGSIVALVIALTFGRFLFNTVLLAAKPDATVGGVDVKRAVLYGIISMLVLTSLGGMVLILASFFGISLGGGDSFIQDAIDSVDTI